MQTVQLLHRVQSISFFSYIKLVRNILVNWPRKPQTSKSWNLNRLQIRQRTISQQIRTLTATRTNSTPCNFLPIPTTKPKIAPLLSKAMQWPQAFLLGWDKNRGKSHPIVSTLNRCTKDCSICFVVRWHPWRANNFKLWLLITADTPSILKVHGWLCVMMWVSRN